MSHGTRLAQNGPTSTSTRNPCTTPTVTFAGPSTPTVELINMSKSTTKRTSASKTSASKSASNKSAQQPAQPEASNDEQKQSEEQKQEQGASVTVPAGDLDERIQWVSEGETVEEREQRADAVYSHEQDSDPDADLDALAERIKAAVAGTNDDDEQNEQDDDEDVQEDEDEDSEVDPDDRADNIVPKDRSTMYSPSLLGVEEPVTGKTKDEAAPDGRIIEPGEEMVFDGTSVGNQVRVNEDVYRKVYPRNTKRPSYLLIYRKGQMVPQSAVKAR